MFTSFKKFSWSHPSTTLLFAAVGLFLGFVQSELITNTAVVISDLFVNLLRLISLPMIFFSIVSTLGSMKNFQEVRSLGSKVIFYTGLTTIVAATVAMACYLFLNPAGSGSMDILPGTESPAPLGEQGSYWSFLIKHIPSNMLEPFISNNVIGVLFLSILFSAAILGLPETQKKTLNDLFSALFGMILKIAGIIMTMIPVAVCAFMILFVRDLNQGMNLSGLLIYILCIVSANLIQAIVVLPAILLWHGINPFRLAKAMWPALTVAFFGKSSSAALPTVIRCAEERAGLNKSISRFSFPMCATVNMNACAGFIIISVLFVSEMHGVKFSGFDYLSWILIGSIAAAGNAAVPMGCYFLASSFLASQNIPLTIMGAILPFYALLDMLETAINVWSDSCVTAIVSKSNEKISSEDISSVQSSVS